ncbi:hypothetical protein C3942_01545 [Solimonas fluminis]|uniref:histidine kinase n=1 Tax=Solimonas fluminis TaxID=2086571 RepID=A0A2S5TKU7_9GAMM|nr:ATP-binding protein [Solimonas fluminis]PPE75604.1 hypothetical protein C3942_01545 [Solimonas fluminis]
MLCLLLAGAAAPAQALDESALVLQSGEFLPDASPALPDDADPRWRPILLPDVWRGEERFAQGSAGWYRFRLDAPAQARQARALYFQRASLNLAVYFNRSFVGDGGRFDEPMTLHANRALLFTLPTPLWRAEGNLVHVYLRGYPHFTGLPPFEAGPLEPLQSRYELRRLLQNHAGLGLMLLTLVASSFGLSFWRRYPDQPVYFWFGLTAACWTVFCANMAFSQPPLPGRYWLALMHSAIDWSFAAQMVFVHRFLEMRRPWLERLMLGLAVLSTLSNFLGSWWQLRYIGSLMHLPGLASLAYCLAFAMSRGRRLPRGEVVLLCVGLGLELLLAVNDALPVIVGAEERYLNPVLLTHFAVPVFLYAMAWRLIDRSLVVRRELDQLNRNLEARVAVVRAEVEQAYAQRYALEREQARLEERERIHRDLHDDLGAKLLTLVHSAGSDQNVALARSALADLREVVSLNPEDTISLRGALSEMETEARQRAQDMQCRLDWQYPDEADRLEVPSGFAFHLARILREALGNALHHGRPGQVEVAMAVEPGGELRLEVRDDGSGGGPYRPGGGMNRMLARARQLRGSVRWLPRPGGGTCVELRAPLPMGG